MFPSCRNIREISQDPQTAWWCCASNHNGSLVSFLYLSSRFKIERPSSRLIVKTLRYEKFREVRVEAEGVTRSQHIILKAAKYLKRVVWMGSMSQVELLERVPTIILIIYVCSGRDMRLSGTQFLTSAVESINKDRSLLVPQWWTKLPPSVSLITTFKTWNSSLFMELYFESLWIKASARCKWKWMAAV